MKAILIFLNFSVTFLKIVTRIKSDFQSLFDEGKDFKESQEWLQANTACHFDYLRD